MTETLFHTLLSSNAQKAFELLYTQHYKNLCVYAYKFVEDTNDAEDIVQATFIKIWNKSHELKHIQNIKAYLVTAVKNSCINWLRSKKTVQLSESDIQLLEIANDSEYVEFYDYDMINSAISQLPAQSKLVFEMKRIQGYSYKEIAEELNISPRTVDSHLTTAMKKLRELLKPVIQY